MSRGPDANHRLNLVVGLFAAAAVLWFLTVALLGPYLYLAIVGHSRGGPTYESLLPIGTAVGASSAAAVVVPLQRRYGRRVYGRADGRSPKVVAAEEVKSRPMRSAVAVLQLPEPGLDRRIARVHLLRSPLLGAGVVGGVAAGGAVVMQAMNREGGFFFCGGVTGLGVLVAALLTDWLGAQHRLFRLRLLKIRRLVAAGRARLDAEAIAWVDRQWRLRRIDAWIARGFFAVIALFGLAIAVDVVPFGVALAIYTAAAVSYIVEFVAVRRRLAWGVMLADVTDIKETVAKLTGGVVGG
jgi:hypothetical protein